LQVSKPRKSDVSWSDFPYRKNAEGRPLCRWCGAVLTGRKRAWCGKACVNQVRLMVDWRYIRGRIMRRDKYRCVLCGARAAEVDHIIELADHGSWWDPLNLRALCLPCHRAKTACARKERAQRRKL
jgi:5-methylcytosine-specific restriction endonuclease McrA